MQPQHAQLQALYAAQQKQQQLQQHQQRMQQLQSQQQQPTSLQQPTHHTSSAAAAAAASTSSLQSYAPTPSSIPTSAASSVSHTGSHSLQAPTTASHSAHQQPTRNATSGSHAPSSVVSSHPPSSSSGPTQSNSAAFPSVALSHVTAFRTSFDQFFHGFDAFLTASENAGAASSPTSASGLQAPAAAVPSETDAITRFYQKYMALEMETDNLLMYLNQTEMKLRVEMDEPSISVAKLQAQQQVAAAAYPHATPAPNSSTFASKLSGPLPPHMALFRAQYAMHKQAAAAAMSATHDSSTSGALHDDAHDGTPSSPRVSPPSHHNTPGDGGTHSTPNHLLTPVPAISPVQPSQVVLTPNIPTPTDSAIASIPMETL